MKKIINALSVLLVLFVVIFGATLLCGCEKHYTEEQHTSRVTALAQKRYIDSGDFTDFKVYPLYNENDELAYFLIDLEPTGYVYVKIDERHSDLSQKFDGISMYYRDAGTEDETSRKPWRRYRLSLNEEEPLPYQGKQWKADAENVDYDYSDYRFETDDEGQFVYYTDSHFKVAGIEDEKRYLLGVKNSVMSDYIPAVKRNGKYLNLVSMEEIDYSPDMKGVKVPNGNIYFNFKVGNL